MAKSTDAAQVEGTQTSGAASLDESGELPWKPSPNAIDPIRLDAAVFDLDGVLTETAAIHGTARKQLFDDVLARQAAAPRKAFQPFDKNSDYRAYVGGRPRSARRAHLLGRARDYSSPRVRLAIRLTPSPSEPSARARTPTSCSASPRTALRSSPTPDPCW